jgi:hypothetical protein
MIKSLIWGVRVLNYIKVSNSYIDYVYFHIDSSILRYEWIAQSFSPKSNKKT